MSDFKPPNNKNKKRPYSCPKCGSEIRLVTTYTGFDREIIDPKTGEWVEDSHIYTERTDIHDIVFSCPTCAWEESAEES